MILKFYKVPFIAFLLFSFQNLGLSSLSFRGIVLSRAVLLVFLDGPFIFDKQELKTINLVCCDPLSFPSISSYGKSTHEKRLAT